MILSRETESGKVTSQLHWYLTGNSCTGKLMLQANWCWTLRQVWKTDAVTYRVSSRFTAQWSQMKRTVLDYQVNGHTYIYFVGEISSKNLNSPPNEIRWKGQSWAFKETDTFIYTLLEKRFQKVNSPPNEIGWKGKSRTIKETDTLTYNFIVEI